jgi:poly-gamma-glutamate capsule biosynthesis protein CapA/YwtB (metallophosphatase superfamily)
VQPGCVPVYGAGVVVGHDGRVRRAPALLAVASSTVLVLAACGGGPADVDEVATPSVSASAEVVPAQPSTPPPPPPAVPIRLAFAGDVNFTRGALTALERDPATALADIAGILGDADLTVVNLETAVTSGGDPAPKEFNFRAPDTAFAALQAAGVDAVSIANNHGMDYGLAGLRDTLAAGQAAGMPVLGGGENEDEAFRPYVVELQGQRVAIVAATQVIDSSLVDSWTAGPGTPGLASAKKVERLLAAVTAAKQQADAVIVFLHWGTELQTCPNEAQQTLAPQLVQAGASAVVGSHAHLLLGGGYLGSAYVHYGLGNFVFSASRDVTRATGVLNLTLTDGVVTASTWTPALITDSIPQPLDPGSAAAASAQWESLRDCTGLSAVPG